MKKIVKAVRTIQDGRTRAECAKMLVVYLKDARKSPWRKKKNKKKSNAPRVLHRRKVSRNI